MRSYPKFHFVVLAVAIFLGIVSIVFYNNILGQLNVLPSDTAAASLLRTYFFIGTVFFIIVNIYALARAVTLSGPNVEVASGLERLRLRSLFEKARDILEIVKAFVSAVFSWAPHLLIALLIIAVLIVSEMRRNPNRRLTRQDMVARMIPFRFLAEIIEPTVFVAACTLIGIFALGPESPQEFSKLTPILFLSAILLRLAYAATAQGTVAKSFREHFSRKRDAYSMFVLLMVLDLIALCVLVPVVFANRPIWATDLQSMQDIASRIIGLGSIPDTLMKTLRGLATPLDLASFATLIVFFSTTVRFVFRFEEFGKTREEQAQERLNHAFERYISGKKITEPTEVDHALPLDSSILLLILEDLQKNDLGEAIKRLRAASVALGKPAALDETFLFVAVLARSTANPMRLRNILDWGMAQNVADQCVIIHAFSLVSMSDEDLFGALRLFSEKRNAHSALAELYPLSAKWFTSLALAAATEVGTSLIPEQELDSVRELDNACESNLRSKVGSTRLLAVSLPYCVDAWHATKSNATDLGFIARRWWRRHGDELATAADALTEPLDTVLGAIHLAHLRYAIVADNREVAEEVGKIENRCWQRMPRTMGANYVLDALAAQALIARTLLLEQQ